MNTVPTPSKPRSWFRRNAIWFVPALVAFALAVLAIFLGSILFIVFGLMRSSEPYQVAVSSARQNEQVVQILGTPIEPSWYLTGNIELKNDSGVADLRIPVHGPSGAGTIFVRASKMNRTWSYSTLRFQPSETDRSISIEPVTGASK